GFAPASEMKLLQLVRYRIGPYSEISGTETPWAWKNNTGYNDDKNQSDIETILNTHFQRELRF
ncbi:hypothetical protein COCMIDRAFT_110066, partial [Bipolaris oryzae ATCC 44560]